MSNTQEQKLFIWYENNKRDLPWRKNKNPYFIWISETMLQQTTTTAVIPYFHRFIKTFPTLESLANAKEADVLVAWSGLGYYSRARNLHKAAKQLHDLKSFPTSAEELIALPGFGPYTSRAVSSIAFNEKVGVLDGNVIRVLSRLNNIKSQWWKTQERKQLQSISDEMAQYKNSATMNQALMELGATICTPKSPYCLSCPWVKNCKSLKANTNNELPMKKPKKSFEIYQWNPEVYTKEINKKVHVALIKNDYAPFLKKQWLFPGTISKKSSKPKTFDFKHTITHHQIYTIPKFKKQLPPSLNSKITWVHINEIKKWNPTSLVEKVRTHFCF